MISVFIADDEYLIRSLIRNSIDWASLDMEVIGEAGDGEEALDFIREYRPQIALVDINMPILNGLELAKQIQESKYPTNVIFLTGYREFEYAKQAVTYHAFDFLLKPISQEEMTTALQNLAQKIKIEQQMTSQTRTMEQEKSKGQLLQQKKFLHRLAFGRMCQVSEERIEEEMNKLGITLNRENLLPLVIEIEVQDAIWNDGLYIYAVLNIFSELMEADGGFSHIYEMSEIDSCAIVICNVLDPVNMEKRVQKIWAEMTSAVKNYFPFSLNGGMGELIHHFSSVNVSVQKAMEALSGKFYHPVGDTLFSAAAKGGTSSQAFLASSHFEELQLCIDSGDREDGLKMIRTLFQEMRQEQVQESFYRMMALGQVAILYSLSAKYKIAPEVIQGGNEPVSVRIDESADCYEVEELLVGCYERLMNAIQKTHQVSKLVFAAQEYIKNHYMNSDLSLRKVSAAVFASSAYISSLFKTELGVSMTEYITVCRMKKAADLLKQDPDINLTAVAEKVGYTDPYYFSRCFKKYYNVTPSKFIANHIWTDQ